MGILIAVCLLVPCSDGEATPILSGAWQQSADCGSGTVAVATVHITEDPLTQQPSMTPDVACGTIYFDNDVISLVACGTIPATVVGSAAGSTVTFPTSGTYTSFGGLGSPYATASFPPCVLVSGYETDATLVVSVTDETAGVATRLAGPLNIDSYRIYEADESLCYPGAAGQCQIVMRRNDVPIAQDVTVSPLDGSSITFSNVTAAGTTNVIELINPVAAVPGNFQLADAPIFYDVVTTAAISGSVVVCLPYPDANDDGIVDGTTPGIDEEDLLLLHEENGAFVNRTVADDPPLAPNPDTVANVICAETPSLSQFVFGASTTSCGDGVVDVGEDCDQGAGLNGHATSCCTASCAFRSAGAVCRPNEGECDGAAETCSGTDGACPSDAVAAPGTPCTSDGNACTTDECDGFGVCGTVSGLTACDDGDFCTTGDACNGTTCAGGPPPACDDEDPCTLDGCESGACVHPPAPDGTICDDGDDCTGGEQCSGGTCGDGTDVCSTVPIVGTKLVVVDRLVASATAKLAFVAKDAAVTKGTATDVDGIGVTLEVSYDSAAGRFTVPAGAHDGTSGWLVNKDTVAKFVHPGAPTGATQAKVVVIKPGVLAKLVGKGLGDEPLDVSGPPTGPVTVVLGVSNGGEEFRHCTAFAACSHASIAAGTGAKLVCKNGAAVSCPTP